ncbi:MAG: pyridoxal phosphate-dependent aminotransferase [Pseudomonadales bacterium]
MTTTDKTPPFAPLVERIAGEGSRAWEIHTRARQLQAEGADIILLSVGDPDFATPPAIVARAVESLGQGDTHYTPIAGLPRLRQAVARNHQQLTGQQVAPEQVVVTAGAQNALYAVAQCILEPGSEVIVPEPTYVTYEAVIGTTGATRVVVPLAPENGFRPDPAAIAAAVTSQTRAILLNTPHNPTGAMIPRDVLEAIAAICRAHDLWLITDEVYAALTFEAEHVSPASLPGMAQRSVVISSLSKSHAMTGWRVGWVVAPRALAAHLETLLLCMLYGTPGFVQEAAIVALSAEMTEQDEMRASYRRRRDLVCGRLEAGQANGAPVSCHRPAGGMFVVIDVRASGLSGRDFAWGLLEQEGVSLLPAEAFGPSARGHLRLSLAASEAVLEEACRRIIRYAASIASVDVS